MYVTNVLDDNVTSKKTFDPNHSYLKNHRYFFLKILKKLKKLYTAVPSAQI